MPKPPLCNAIRDHLQVRRLSVRAVAERLGVPEPTLRTWLHRNKFPAGLAVELCKQLDLAGSREEVEGRFQVDGWVRSHGGRAQLADARTLRDAFRVTDRRRNRYADDLAGFWEEIGYLIDRMADGDLLAVASATVTPTEMDVSADGVALRRRISGAVGRGGRFLYLRPTQGVLVPYRELWHYHEFPDQGRLDQEFRAFVDLLTRDLGGRSPEPRVRGRVAQILVERSPFWAPGFVIGMFQTQDSERNLDRRMWCRLPGGRAGILYRERNSVFDERFAWFVTLSLGDELKALRPVARGRKTSPRTYETAVRLEALDAMHKILEALYPWESVANRG